jgi:hypothetical protein
VQKIEDADADDHGPSARLSMFREKECKQAKWEYPDERPKTEARIRCNERNQPGRDVGSDLEFHEGLFMGAFASPGFFPTQPQAIPFQHLQTLQNFI